MSGILHLNIHAAFELKLQVVCDIFLCFNSGESPVEGERGSATICCLLFPVWECGLLIEEGGETSYTITVDFVR